MSMTNQPGYRRDVVEPILSQWECINWGASPYRRFTLTVIVGRVGKNNGWKKTWFNFQCGCLQGSTSELFFHCLPNPDWSTSPTKRRYSWLLVKWPYDLPANGIRWKDCATGNTVKFGNMNHFIILFLGIRIFTTRWTRTPWETQIGGQKFLL